MLDIPLLKETANRYGIFYTIHLDENLNVSDFNPYIADGYRRTVSETIQLAKRLDIPIINMHLPRGVYFTLPNKKVFLFSEYKETYLKSIYDFRTMCEKAIGDSGITICIENCDGFLPFQREAVDILLQSGVFGLTFDIGHNLSCGNLVNRLSCKIKPICVICICTMQPERKITLHSVPVNSTCTIT